MSSKKSSPSTCESTISNAVGLGSTTRRKVVAGLASLPLFAMGNLSHAQVPPTSKVNTTKLAVTDKEVTVGILHSSTGTMAISETGSIQAEKLAISQINAMGGVLGRKIKVIQEDGASDWPTFAEKAKKLLEENHVAAITNRDIGDILGMSPRTVNKHLEHIFRKLGVETRSAAAALASGSLDVDS